MQHGFRVYTVLLGRFVIAALIVVEAGQTESEPIIQLIYLSAVFAKDIRISLVHLRVVIVPVTQSVSL